MASLQFIPPMLATLVRTLPEGPQWEYELKLDGYRLEAIKDGAKVRLYSRRGDDFTRQFARIAEQVSTIKTVRLFWTAKRSYWTTKASLPFKCCKTVPLCRG